MEYLLVAGLFSKGEWETLTNTGLKPKDTQSSKICSVMR